MSSEPPRHCQTFVLPLLILLTGCVTDKAAPVVQAGTPGAVALSGGAISSFNLNLTERVGTDIYRLDIATAKATDLLVGRGIDLRREGVVGWITEVTEGGILVRYLRRNVGDAVVPYADILFDRTDMAASMATVGLAPLTGTQAAQYAARRLALSVVKEPCSPVYNTVALRHPERDAWLIYVLAATDRSGAMVAGGHYRIIVSNDGRQVLEVDRLSRSCLTFPPQPPNAVGAIMTHILSPTPIEIHVFLSLLHQQPLYVRTSEGTWLVESGTIRRQRP
jgi:hypothetical protein